MILLYHFPGYYLECTCSWDSGKKEYRKVYGEDIEFEYEPSEEALRDAAIEYLMVMNPYSFYGNAESAFDEGAHKAIASLIDRYDLMHLIRGELSFEGFCEKWFEEEAREEFEEGQGLSQRG